VKRFTLGSSSIGDLEKKYVAEVLDRNYISPGPVVEHVERECARLHSFKRGLAVNSGQSAIFIALQAIINGHLANKQDKPLVAVPASTYISTLSAAVLAGCDIVLIDVEIETGNMCHVSLVNTIIKQRELDDPIDIVIPVHLYGKACDHRIKEICKTYKLWVIEDACEATFAPGIGWGHILTTSFYTNHLISAGGGGMIMTNDDQLNEYCWKLINHGRTTRMNNDDIHRISEKFHFDTWGHSFKWNDVNAAIARAQIERKDELYAVRCRNAETLTTMFQNNFHESMAYGAAPFNLPEHKDHCFMMYPIVLHEPLNTANVIRYLNEHGVEVRRMMPITNQPIVREYFGGSALKEFPNADLINRQGFYMGVHPELTESDMEEMGSVIDEAIKQEANRLNID